MIKYKTIKYFRIVLFLICLIGLIIKTGIFIDFKPYTFLYFTNISNFIQMIITVFLILKPNSSNNVFNFFKLYSLIAMVITGIVFWTVLLPSGFKSGYGFIQNAGSLFLHFIAPIMTILDWVIFHNNFKIKIFYPILWVLMPMAYFIIVYFVAQMGNFIPNQNTAYPYNFMAVDLFGWNFVLRNLFFIGLGFVVLGYFVYCINNFILINMLRR